MANGMAWVKRAGAVMVALALSGSAGAVFAAPKAGAKPAAKPAAKAAPAQVAATELELVHHLPKAQADALQKLVDEFNAQNPATPLILSSRDWQSGGLPLMMILDREGPTGGKPAIKPLWQAMKEAGQPLETLAPPPQMVPTPLDATGKVQALPIGLSTPVMFYNKDLFRKAGLDTEAAPKNWFDLQVALAALYNKGVTCPYVSSWSEWVHVENLSAWHNVPFAAKDGSLSVNTLLPVKHVAMMTTWVKGRYMHGFGHRDEGDAHFASGECAVITTSSAAYPALRQQAKFAIGVAPLPVQDGQAGAPQNTLADGPALWLGAGHKPQEYQVAAKFVRFMLAPEKQVEWQIKAGFLPLNRAGLLAVSSDLLKDDLIHNRVAVDELKNKPVTEASRASRVGARRDIQDLLNQKLDEVWSGQKPAMQVMDEAVQESRKTAVAPKKK